MAGGGKGRGWVDLIVRMEVDLMGGLEGCEMVRWAM